MTESPEAAVRTADLKKTYPASGPRPAVPAVQGIDLDVPRGEFFGLLGPNGAGNYHNHRHAHHPRRPHRRQRGCLRTRRGEGRRRDQAPHRGGVAEQHPRQRIHRRREPGVRGRYFGLGARDARKRAAELLELFGLTDARGGNPFEISGGQAKRVMICRALIHGPEVLFLDEPTAT